MTPPAVAGSRYATADFELDGVEVNAGDELRVVWAVGNMDDDVFPEPTTVASSAPTTATSRSPAASIAAWAPTWRGSSCASPDRRSTVGSPTTGPTRTRRPAT